MVQLYFSGLETGWNEVVLVLDSGVEHKPKCIMMSYLQFKGSAKKTAQLREFRNKYHGKVMVDSGAHSFLNNWRLKKEGKKGESFDAEKIADSGDYDSYIDEYLNWLDKNRDVYDWVVELDIQQVVGNEKVNEWRVKFLEKKIPLVIVLHFEAGDGGNRDSIDTVKDWKAKGCEYFGIGGLDKTNGMHMSVLRQASELGVKMHLFAFTPLDLFSYKQWITSVDSTSWLMAGKQGQLFQLKGKFLSNLMIKDNPILIKRVMDSSVLRLFGEKAQKDVADKKYFYLNFWNLTKLQEWADVNNEVPQYELAVKAINDGDIPAPGWLTETDREGKSKALYLASRFNATKTGVYAKQAMKYAMECDKCVIKASCRLYEKDGLCGFLPYWRSMGAKTRNKEQIVRRMEEIVAEQFVRYQRGLLFETEAGGVLDRSVSAVESELLKNLELLHKVKYGVSGVGTKIGLMVNKEGVKFAVQTDPTAVLNELREEYGPDLIKRIEKKSLNEEEREGEGEVEEEKETVVVAEEEEKEREEQTSKE